MVKGEYQLRQAIVEVGRRMYARGLISASEGNISARLDNERILITPSGLHKGFLTSDDLLVIDTKGKMIGAPRGAGKNLQPTSELPLHLESYRLRPDIGAVVHGHPPTTIALSIAGIPLASCLLPEVIVFLGLIPTTEYATPSSEETVNVISQLLPNHDAIVLQRHGSLTVGTTPMEGFIRLEIVEQSAHIAFMLNQLGAVNPLSPDEVQKLLKMRSDMGLARPGESQEFCDVCGVCHTGKNHLPILRVKGRINQGSRNGMPVGPQSLPPISQPFVDEKEVRAIVSKMIRKTLGND